MLTLALQPRPVQRTLDPGEIPNDRLVNLRTLIVPLIAVVFWIRIPCSVFSVSRSRRSTYLGWRSGHFQYILPHYSWSSEWTLVLVSAFIRSKSDIR